MLRRRRLPPLRVGSATLWQERAPRPGGRVHRRSLSLPLFSLFLLLLLLLLPLLLLFLLFELLVAPARPCALAALGLLSYAAPARPCALAALGLPVLRGTGTSLCIAKQMHKDDQGCFQQPNQPEFQRFRSLQNSNSKSVSNCLYWPGFGKRWFILLIRIRIPRPEIRAKPQCPEASCSYMPPLG